MNLSFSTRGWGDLSWDELLSAALDMKFTGIEVYNIFKFPEFTDRGGPFHKHKIAATLRQLRDLKLHKHEKVLEGVSIGDGPIDAAFLAVEQITGQHYELDDFQIQAVTEGREAMGQTVVKLRSSGKVYSGRGISTDIVGASLRAYLNAVNKIIYEEG